MKKFIFAAFSLLVSLQINGQSLSNYSSIRNTGVSYASISGSGNTIGSWRNSAASMLDDNRSDFIDIGFDFWYNGARYTQFCVSTNGFIDFSSNTDDGGAFADDFGYDNTAFTNSNIANFTQLAIAALYDDLAAPSAATSLGTVVKYALTGSAPSRTLTVEWINMRYSGNSTPSLNFQVQLVESSGQILVNYGSMSAGTQVFSYCTGLNASTMSAPPTAAQLKELQAANGNGFSNTVQNNLASLPASNSQYIFSPVVPTPTAGTLAFSGISTTSLTLNWTNWAANEIGYVIYNSTDGINYSFVSQTAANATSGPVTGLLPGTSYYWKLYAVTEGCLSSAISGTQATNAAGNKTSNGSGNWSAANTWSPNGVPGAGDNVTIAAGHIVQINVATAQCNSLTVNGKLEFNNGGTPYSFTVNNNTTIGSTGTFWVPYNSNATSTVTFKGNIVNNGVLSFSSDPTSAARAYFIKNGNVTVSGTGSSSFATIYMDLGSTNANTLEINTPNFLSQTNFLTIQNGIFKLSSTNVATVVPCTTQVSLNKVSGFWLNAPNTTCSFSAGIDLAGKLTVTGGTMNIGNAANEDLQSTGATVSLSTGAINVAGKFYSSGTSNCRFSMTSGAFNVSTAGSTNTSYAPFHLNGSSTFTMSGGLIGVINEGGSGAQDLGYNNTASGSVTGGTLQLGAATTVAGSTMQVVAALGAGDFIVNSSNVTAKLLTNSLTVLNNITLYGNLFANNLNISLGGNWTNNGGAFTPGTNTVYFNGNATQNIFKSGGESFNGLDFSNAGVKTFSSAITASSSVVINSGAAVDVGTANNQLTVKRNFVNNGTFTSRAGLVLFDGTISQNIGGSSLTSFYDITLNNNSGASLTGSVNLIDALNLNNGTLNVNGQQLTMVSTATATARISQITGSGDISGNVNVQRFVPGGTTGWANFGTCISSGLTFSDWDDDFAITCPNCPDGYYNFTSIYSYSEAVAGTYSDTASYVRVLNISDPIVAGKGYWVYFGDGQYTTTDITIDVTGTVRKFNYTIPLSYSNYGSAADDGWNLISNPYPSPISWAALKGTTPNIDNAIYIYNTDLNGGAGSHATYINGISSPAVGSGGVGDVIPLGQAFYVHSTGATALNATEAIKTSGNPTYLKTESGPSSLMRIYLDGPYSFHDETVLYLQPGASNGFDMSYDAYKMAGQYAYAPFLALENAGNQFQVNGIPPIVGSYSTELKTLSGYADTYTISAENFSTFPSGACLNLYDKFTQTSHDLKTSPYIFTLSDTTTVARFVLTVTSNSLQVNSNLQQPSCQQPFGGEITAAGANAGPWNFTWKDPSGNVVKTSVNKASADTLNGITAGNYELQVNTVGQCDNNKSYFLVNAIVKPVAQFSCIDTVKDVSNNGTVQFNNNSINSVFQSWDFGDNLGVSNLYSPSYNYTAPGVFIIRLVSSSQTGCNDTVYKAILVQDKFVGIKNQSVADEIIVRNTGNYEFVIEQNLIGDKKMFWELRDALGRSLQTEAEQNISSLRLNLDLSNYSGGIYYLFLKLDDQECTIKLPVR